MTSFPIEETVVGCSSIIIVFFAWLIINFAVHLHLYTHFTSQFFLLFYQYSLKFFNL